MFKLQLAKYSASPFKLHIIEHTATRLNFQIQPWLIWIVMGGILISVSIFAVVQQGEVLLIAPVFILIATLGLLFFGQIIVCDFDRTSDQFRHEYRGLFKRKHKVYPLSAITQVIIQAASGSPSFRVALVLDSGQQVPLVFYYNDQYQDKVEMGQLVANFLQVELIS